MKKTRQGVRDLNPPGHSNPSRRKPLIAPSKCHHIWLREVSYDCWHDARVEFLRCAICQETRE